MLELNPKKPAPKADTAQMANNLEADGAASGATVKIAEPRPFTPLFIFSGDRQKLVSETAKDAGYPASQIDTLLPPFFLQSR
jgi:hypothetical protein